jgi:LmbE family N-acetylglucosaminyl deacetylase
MIDWKRQRVLILSPHPDDEVIGCGGLISKVKDAGGQVFVNYVTLGDTRDRTERGWSTADERIAEIQEVAGLLGFDKWDIALPGARHHLRLDAMAQHDLIAVLEHASTLSLQAVEPTVVLLPSPVSYNQDHRAVAEAAITALRPVGLAGHAPVEVVAIFEEVADQWTPQSDVAPNLFVELQQHHLDAKLNAMRAYASQVRPHPHTRSLEALQTMAVVRGAHSGLGYAEAYRCMRWLG